MITVQNSTMVIPNLTNATAVLTEQNRVEIQMNDGYVFWDKHDYTIDGVYEKPAPEDICYSRWGSFTTNWDFSGIIEAVESEVPGNQFFGKDNEETI